MKYFLFAIFLIFSQASYAEEAIVQYEEVEPQVKSSLEGFAENTISMMKSGGATTFDYSEESVKFLSSVIDKEGPSYSENARNRLPVIWGAYLGTAIIKKHGGKWIKFDNTYAVLVNNLGVLFPIQKVDKHISNGEEDAIYGLYVLAGTNIKDINNNAEKP